MGVEARAPVAKGPAPSARTGAWMRPAALVAVLGVVLVLAIIVATAVGVVRVPFHEVVGVIGRRLFGINLFAAGGSEAIIWSVRLPRVLVAGLVGFGLALSGAAMQGLFMNPLASPGIAGVSSGGSLGAVVAILLGWQAVSSWLVPLTAFAGALGATAVVYALATRSGRTDTASLLLAGVAVGAFCSAVIAIFYHFVPDGVLRQVAYWLMGNLGGKRWEHVTMIAPFVLGGSLGLALFAPELNILASGEDDARSLGVAVERTKRWVLVLVAMVAGSAISVSGLIGFVGLIVPHGVRLLIGPDHRWLLPASGLGGAAFLILCDLVARTAFSPVELQTGTVTALCGVPFFLSLLARRREFVRWE